MSEPCVIYVANRGFALAGSRLPLIRTFLARNWKVIVATADDRFSRALEGEGACLERVEFSRGGMDVTRDFAAYKRLREIYEASRPRLIHHFHAKPVMLGSFAARQLSSKGSCVVNTITGLGYAFARNGVNRWIAGHGYKLVKAVSSATVFQNQDDLRVFLDNGWVEEAGARLIIGSGVDIGRFRPARKVEKGRRVTALMVARLLWQKGIKEYIEAARQVRSRFPDTQFQLAGEFDDSHPDRITESELEKMNADGAVEFLGFLPAVENALMAADLFVYPSYYREGVPRVVLEACACALPTVAADVAGTREAVIHEKTGYLVRPGDVRSLVAGISRLMASDDLRERMGRQARKMAEDCFDINVITAEQLNVYRGAGVRIAD
jgi:glycosyltransferase involved in cell wall biosynthesis